MKKTFIGLLMILVTASTLAEPKKLQFIPTGEVVNILSVGTDKPMVQAVAFYVVGAVQTAYATQALYRCPKSEISTEKVREESEKLVRYIAENLQRFSNPKVKDDPFVTYILYLTDEYPICPSI